MILIENLFEKVIITTFIEKNYFARKVVFSFIIFNQIINKKAYHKNEDTIISR